MTCTAEDWQTFTGSWLESMRKPMDMWIRVAATNPDKKMVSRFVQESKNLTECEGDTFHMA